MNKVLSASAYLISAAREGRLVDSLPADLRPSDKQEAYAMQAALEQQASTALVAWKIAATSVAGQKHIGVSGPLAGRYLAARTVRSGAAIPFGNNHMKVAEVEFAFTLGRDLPPRARAYSEEEVFAAVDCLRPAIEIPDSRYEDFARVGEYQLIADNACANWLCLGEPSSTHWRELDLAAFAPTGRVNNSAHHPGLGANVLGSPGIALTWLANELSSLGVGMKAGQTASTGTCVVPMPIKKGDEVEGDFGSLGKVSLRLY